MEKDGQWDKIENKINKAKYMWNSGIATIG